MDRKTEKIRNRYDRVSKIYDLLEGPMERKVMSRWRRDIMHQLNGRVLEVGIGTGKNMEYYPDHLDVTGIDFSYRMLLEAKRRTHILKKDIKLLQMDVQNMIFEDDTFDTVVATFVFCSVHDPIRGLQELMRVCKPGGKIIMLEHMRSQNILLGLLMDMLNPIVRNVYGANINRSTLDNIKYAGFSDVTVINLWGDIVKKIIIDNKKG